MCSSHTFCERSTVILDVFKVIYYLFLPLFFPSIFWKHAGYMWLPWEQKIIFSVENIFWQWVFISQTKGFHLVKHTRASQGKVCLGVSVGSETWGFSSLRSHCPSGCNSSHRSAPRYNRVRSSELSEPSASTRASGRLAASPQASPLPTAPCLLFAFQSRWPCRGRREGECLINFPFIKQLFYYWHLRSAIADIKSFSKQNVINEKSIGYFQVCSEPGR